jgi:hypothetical protein
VPPAGLEPATRRLEGGRSIQTELQGQLRWRLARTLKTATLAPVLASSERYAPSPSHATRRA